MNAINLLPKLYVFSFISLGNISTAREQIDGCSRLFYLYFEKGTIQF